MTTKLEPISPDEAKQMYLDARRHEVSQSTLDGYHYRLKHFIRWCQQVEGIDNMNNLSGRKLQKFKTWRRDDGTWMVGDAEIDRLPSNPTPDRDGPSEPQPEVVLYCQTRAGTTEERLDEIENALGDIGYELRENDRAETLSIIVPPVEPRIDPDEVTRDEVYAMAQDLDIDGLSDMSKAELINAVEAAR